MHTQRQKVIWAASFCLQLYLTQQLDSDALMLHFLPRSVSNPNLQELDS